jgi:hypothetical protein
MEFTLQDLYDFANVSAPGGNHYIPKVETERVWNTEKGRILSSFVDSDSFYQHFIMVHIYGAMAQRYSGVFDTKESYVLEDNTKLKDFYHFLSQSTFPFGYRFKIIIEKMGYKLIIQKDNEVLQNINVNIGVEYYSEIPDHVHRPPYYTKPFQVEENLSCSLAEYSLKVKNRNTWENAIKKLRVFESEINKKNLMNYIKSCDEDKIREIYRILCEEVEYYEENDEEKCLPEVSIEEMIDFIMEFEYKCIKDI